MDPYPCKLLSKNNLDKNWKSQPDELANIPKNHFEELKDFESNQNFGCFEILAIRKLNLLTTNAKTSWLDFR
jgi:hypothetical protein